MDNNVESASYENIDGLQKSVTIDVEEGAEVYFPEEEVCADRFIIFWHCVSGPDNNIRVYAIDTSTEMHKGNEEIRKFQNTSIARAMEYVSEKII
jgi:hypothetical protein